MRKNKELIISGGVFKQRRILCPQHDIRPVMAKVRNSVFQRINNYLYLIEQQYGNALHFLDVFSGSGVMAIEAVSRGFVYATAVEKDSRKWKIMLQNFSIRSHSFSLVRSNVELFIQRVKESFAVLYVDPPFSYRYKQDLLKRIVDSGATHSQSLIVFHLPSRESKDFCIFGDTLKLKYIDTKVFGASSVVFFCMKE